MLVASGSVFNVASSDVIVMAITSKMSSGIPEIEITPDAVEGQGLPVHSKILPCKIFSVAQTRLGKCYCRISPELFAQALVMLKEALS